jgi:hypothetical protein
MASEKTKQLLLTARDEAKAALDAAYAELEVAQAAYREERKQTVINDKPGKRVDSTEINAIKDRIFKLSEDYGDLARAYTTAAGGQNFTAPKVSPVPYVDPKKPV